MTIKVLIKILIVQIVGVFFAIGIFRTIHPIQFAAILAGGSFVAIGFYVVRKCFLSRQCLKLACFWVGLAYLAGIAVPMFVQRLIHFNLDFSQVYIWGLPGPEFHRWSEKMYGLFIGSTFFDLIRSASRKSKRS